MNQLKIQNFLTKNVSTLSGVGSKIKKLLKRKKIEKVSDFCGTFLKDILIDQIYKP